MMTEQNAWQRGIPGDNVTGWVWVLYPSGYASAMLVEDCIDESERLAEHSKPTHWAPAEPPELPENA